MKRFFAQNKGNYLEIDGEELKHLAVLRCEIGEQIVCICNDEFEYFCTISEITKKYVRCEIKNKQICVANPKKNIVLFQGLPKLDKLELITQKATELGISKIIPFESDFTIAKPNENKIERLKKITIEACKQCGRSVPVQIEAPVKFKNIISLIKDFDLVLFANETKKDIMDINFNNSKNIAIIIGSEGGFSEREIQALINENVTQIGLGQRILRTETASIVLCGLVSYLTKN